MQPESSSARRSLRHGGDFVGLVGHFQIWPSTSELLAAHALTITRAAVAAVQRPAQGFAIQRDALVGDGGAQGLRPGHEHLQEGLGFERGKDAVEGVMFGNARAQAQKSAEPLAFGHAEILHVVEAFAAAEQTAQGDDEHVDQIVFAACGDARVGQLLELFDQTESVMRLHPVSCNHTVQKYKAKMSH